MANFKHLIITIAAIIGAAAVGIVVGYFMFHKKPVEPITNTVYVTVPEYRDTCLGQTIDSLEIYRTIRKGLVRKINATVSKVEESPVSVADTTKTVYDVFYEDSLSSLTGRLWVTGTLDSFDYSMRLDTLEIAKKFTVRDSVLVPSPPIMIPVDVERIVVQNKAFNPIIFGASADFGTSLVSPENFFVQGGLYFQDRKFRNYGAFISTDKRVGLCFRMPILTSKK